MRNKPCGFCEQLHRLIKRGDMTIPCIKSIRTVALVEDSYRNSKRCSRISYYGHKLNYCPTCGTKIDGGTDNEK